MKLRIGRVLAGTMTLAAATIMATAGNASAGQLPPAPSGGWDHHWHGTGVDVYVEEHGDMIYVCDTSANGHSAWVAADDITLNISGYKQTVTTGAGTCTGHDASDGAKYDLAEGSRISLNYDGVGTNGEYVTSFVNDH
ncbi:hypothetical protein [Actinomadura nitritigenes]|uniref:hypothetical protein n=1 Tax=Actinomadura nitritigenes TaxID=134602 RepID=UPI003D91EC14